MRRDDIVLLDGAVGTSLWEKSDDKVAVWRYNVENPRIVSELNREFMEAGAEIVLANTFGANRYAVGKTDYTVKQIVSEGVRLCKEAVAGKAKVALSAGPLPQLLEPYGDLTEEECFKAYDEQISAGMEYDPDVITLQTFMDVEMMRVAAEAAAKYDKPILCMATFNEVGKTIMGQSVEKFVKTMKGLPIAAIGMNCSLGPEKAVPVIASFRQYTDLPLAFKPNAGKPILQGGESKMEYDVDTFVEDCLPALEYDVKYIGGCCGSNATYIRALKKRIWG